MRPQRNHLILTFAVFLAFLAIGTSRSAWAGDDCDPTGTVPFPAGLTGLGIGGYSNNPTSGIFTINYQKAVQEAVQKRAMAGYGVQMGAPSIDASAAYCWNQIKLIMTAIAVWGPNPIAAGLAAALDAIVQGIIQQLINQGCQAVLSAINNIKNSALSIFNKLLCLPIPQLQLPKFNLTSGAFSSSSAGQPCPGTPLMTFDSVPVGIPALGSSNIMWNMWGTQSPQ